MQIVELLKSIKNAKKVNVLDFNRFTEEQVLEALNSH